MTLEAAEFIGRFLLHVLPKGLVRIRHFGFLANRCRRQKISHCRKLLDPALPMNHKAPIRGTTRLRANGKRAAQYVERDVCGWSRFFFPKRRWSPAAFLRWLLWYLKRIPPEAAQ